jgi:adenylate cyclase
MSQSRQLAAIMFTDIVGYTALMGNDEHKAFTLLDKNRQLQKPIIEEFNGRWIKEIGDGVMASFSTVSDAVNAAIKIQEACNAANDFQLRIGIHQGEVVFEEEDVFGDAVNIAARIQAAANPGCIFISEAVHHNVINKNDIKSQFVKEEILKNVSQPVRMYQVLFAGSEIIIAEKPVVLALENSIAVLPFVNMSNDPEQEYFSDGISEDIINDLAQVSGLKVIGRTSSFAFKGKNLDLKLIGEQLKVSYLLEGSVRKSGSKLRITAQLIKVSDGYHLYSEKFDREMEDVFAIQDEISLAILNAIKIKLFGAEKVAVLKRYTDNVEAYQLYLQGRFYYNKYTPDAFIKAIEYLHAAITIEPEYALAYSGLSYCYLTLWYFNWMPADKCLPPGLAAAQQSLKMDAEIAEGHLAIGRVLLHYEMKLSEATIEYKKSLAINPNSAECQIQLGMCAAHLGKYTEAREHAKIADGLDPFSLMNLWFIGAIYWATEDYEKVLAYGKRLVDLEPYFFGGHMWFGSFYMVTGKMAEGITEFELGVTFSPDILNLNNLARAYGMAGEKMKARAVIERMGKIEGAEIAGNNYFGSAYASIGELDTAFAYFDKAMDGHEGNMFYIKYLIREVPEFMEDPRAKTLFKRLGVA